MAEYGHTGGGLGSEAVSAQPQPGSWRRWAGAIAVAIAAMLGAAAIAPQVAISPVLAFAIGFGAIAGSVLAVSALCPRPRKRALLVVAGCGALLLGLLFIGRLHPPPTWLAAALVTAALLGGATVLGALVGGGVEHPGHLLMVVGVSSVADAGSVLSPEGPSAMIAQSEVALSVLALPWPMLGTDAIEPMLGGGDVVFAALYLAASRTHGLSQRRTLVALGLGFAATLAFVVGLEQAVPALPFLGLAMLVAHPEARVLPTKDRKRAAAIAGLVLVAAASLALRR